MANPGQVTVQLNMFEVDHPFEPKIFAVAAGLQSLAICQQPMMEALGYYDTSTETLSRHGLGLIIEVAEFLNETPWKSWKRKSAKEVDLDRVKDEFADLISFIGNWVNFLNMMGISTEDLALAYEAKLLENNTRFGVTGDDTTS